MGTRFFKAIQQAAGAFGLVVQRSGSTETVDLQQWQDETGVALARVGATGGATLPTLAVSTPSAVTVGSTNAESFVATDGSNWPAHFTGTLNSGATRTIVSNAGRLVTPATGAYVSTGNTVASGISTRVDSEVQIDVSFADTAEQYFGVCLRAANSLNGAGPQNGYYLQLNVQQNTWQIARCNSSTTTNISTTLPFTYTAGVVNHVRFRLLGSSVFGKVWTGSTEPTSWGFSGTDATPYLTTGTYALGYVNGGAGTAKTATISAASLSTVTNPATTDIATFTSGGTSGQLAIDSQARLRFLDGSLQSTAVLQMAYGAPSGGWQTPQIALGVTSTAVASGAVSFLPFDVGPTARSYNALGVQVGTAQVGGTTTTTLGVYPDDGSGGRPNTAAGPIVTTNVVLTATGSAAGSVSWNPNPGRYWIAFLYVATAAPTTTALINFISVGGGIYSTIAGNPSRSIIMTSGGQTALPTTAVSLSPSSNQPLVSAKAA